MQHRNESEKLKRIYEAYKNRMYITACRVLNDPYKAEDAVHETFIAISKNVEKLGDVDSVSTASYVIKAAKNTAINMIKKQNRETVFPLDERIEAEDDSLLDKICTRENFKTVVSAILALDEKYRDVLSLYYLNELTVSEIAVTLSRKESTVKQQLSRGRRKLISNIEKEENHSGEQKRNA